MSPVFLDTSGMIAVVNVDDQWHAAAEGIWRGLINSGAPLVTSSLILIEIGDGLSRVENRHLAVRLREGLLTSSRIEVVQTTADDESRAWKLYAQRVDKSWGMTDCVSMILVEERKVREVFSADHHFEQAGLDILLKR
jgi:predicted nucleic acid-binding protein